MINIDGLHISQCYPSFDDVTGELLPALPVVSSGLVCKYTPESLQHFAQKMDSPLYDGAIDLVDLSEWSTASALIYKGSYSSSIYLRSDGHRVEMRGNPLRFGRPDNVFTGDFAACIARASELCQANGLPPFSVGEYNEFRDHEQNLQHEYLNGATVSMIHANKKLATGSPENCEAFLNWCRFQTMPNLKGDPQDNGMQWGGKGSTRLLLKAYGKAQEILAHCKEHGRTRAEVLADPVYQYCHQNGIVCLEAEFRRQLLIDSGMRFLGDITMQKIEDLFDQKAQLLLNRASKATTDIDLASLDVPSGAIGYLRAWMQGSEVWPLMVAKSKATAYRYASALRKYGIDIRVPLNPDAPEVPALIRVVDVMEIKEPPSWYWDYQTRMIAEAANADPFEEAA